MPLAPGNAGTNADGMPSADYCSYCYAEGRFLQDLNMSQMIEFCVRFTDQMNALTGWKLTPEQARRQMRRTFPSLERWRRRDGRPLTEKAADLLAKCTEVTLVSIDAAGFPRPVPMGKGHSVGCGEVWMATGAGSVKAADFAANPRSGLSYSYYGDSVGLRGRVELHADDAVRRRMWRNEWLDHFPGGPTDPDYLLVRFLGQEATIYIDGEFAHVRLAGDE